MTEMTHLLITRFNLNYGDLYPYSEAWMEHRMALFERYCLPSVRRQRVRRGSGGGRVRPHPCLEGNRQSQFPRRPGRLINEKVHHQHF